MLQQVHYYVEPRYGVTSLDGGYNTGRVVKVFLLPPLLQAVKVVMVVPLLVYGAYCRQIVSECCCYEKVLAMALLLCNQATLRREGDFSDVNVSLEEVMVA